MTRITAPPPPSSPPLSPPPLRHSPAALGTPRSRRRHSPSPCLALTPSSSSSTYTSSRPMVRPLPRRTYAAAEWVALPSHPTFSGGYGWEGGGGGGAAWDASTLRLYVWGPSARGVHRICVRIRDAEAGKDGEDVAVEAAVPSEMLMLETDLGYKVTHLSLNTDGSSLLLSGSHNISVLKMVIQSYADLTTGLCQLLLRSYPETMMA